MAQFVAGEVVVPVVPDARGFHRELRKSLVPGAEQIGREVGAQIARGVQAQLGDVYAPLREAARREQARAGQDGAQVGGAFARGVKAQLEAAFRSLPKIELDADASEAQRKVQELRARIETLSGKTVGIDIDAGAALAEVAAIRRELEQLDGKDASVDVRADIGQALAQLAAAETALSGLDGRTAHVRVDVDISGALAAIGTLSMALAGLAAIPVGASLTAGIAGMLGPLAAAGAGFAGLAAVAIPSIGRINEALEEQEKAGQRAASGLTAAAGATRNLAIESLQAQIRQLQAANAADQLRNAQDRVKDAVAGVAAAKDRLKQAAQSAAQAQAAAAQRVAQAERALADAQKAAIRAQEDLNRARQQAIKTLADLGRSLRGNALDQREAALDLREAEAELAKAREKGDPEAIERAEIAYERIKLRIEELQVQEQELQEQQAKGVEGQDAVVAAKERLEQASQRVLDQEKALAKAYEDAGKAGEEAARRVAEARKAVRQAEERVDDAKRALEALKRQQQIQKLQEKIQKIREREQAKAQAAAAARAAQAAAAAQAKATEKTRALTPAERAAAEQIKAFKDAYEDFQKALAPSVLPAITGALGLLQKAFKPLTPLVQGTAGALVELEKSAGRALGGDFWQGFFRDLSAQAPDAVTGLGKSIGNITTGIAGLIRAFLPFVPTFVGGLEQATAAFAKWGQDLGKSEGFKAFMDYVRQTAPTVIGIFKDIWTVLTNLLSGLAGDGATALDIVKSITGWLASLSPETLRAFTLAVLGVVAAFKTWKIIKTTVDGVRRAIQIAQTVWSGLSKAASLAAKGVSLAAKGIGAAARGVGAAWSGISTAAQRAAQVARSAGSAIANAARTAGSVAARGATAAWDGIRTAAQRAGAAARTAGTAIANGARAAAGAAASLGRAALEYGKIAAQAALARARTLAFAATQAVIRGATLAWAAAQKVLNIALKANPIGLIVTAIGLLVAGLVYAWNNSETFRNIVTAAWEAIKTAIKTAWEGFIKPALEALWSFIKDTLGPVFEWIWQNIIVPAWQGIQTAIQTAWNNFIKPALQAIWNFIKNTLGPVFTWIWQNIIVPAWQGIQTAIKAAWENVIKPALQAIWNFIKNTLGPVFTWIWKNIIVPAWDGIKSTITTVWEKFLKPVFDKLYEVIFKTIPDGFKKGVELIRTAWDKVKEAARAPVKFIVDVVYNNGIVKVWNTVADFLKLPKLSTLAFARGGVVPGYTPGKDVALAAVSGGEAIMRPEWTKVVGEEYVHKMNAAARRGGVAGVARALGIAGDPSGFAGAFAEGGIVGDVKKVLAGGIKIGAEKLLNPLLDAAERAMGDSAWGRMLVGIPRKMISEVINFLGEKEMTAGAGKAIAYARAQIGKPYQWGGTGPDAFDCSGLVMRAWQAAGVKDIPRTSQQQMAWVKPVQSPSPGDLGFPHPGHVWLYSSPTTIIEAPYTGAFVREVPARAAQLIGRPPQAFARGGIVGYARGGIRRPRAHITDTPTVLFGEAGPEAFIPLRRDRRSLRVLGQAAAAMGQAVVPASSLAGGGYLEALQAAAFMAAGGVIPPTGSGSAASAAVRQVSATVSQSTGTISATLVKSSEMLREALAEGTTVLTGAVGDAWQRASAGLTSTSQTLSAAWDQAAEATAQSITQVAEAETEAASKLVVATTNLGETVAKATGELQATLVQVAATAGKAAAGAGKTSAKSAAAPVDKIKSSAMLASVRQQQDVVVLVSKNEDIPVRFGHYDQGGWLMPGTSLVYNGTGRPEPVLTDQQWRDLRSGGGPLVQIEEFHATPEQSPFAIAQELRHMLGAQLRMR